MNTLFIAERELKASFRRPLAYVVIIGFIALCALYTFSLHPFFVINRSTTRPLFEFIPFALAFFVPAIAMGLIAEERRSGMLELLQTWPIGDGHLVVGKFLCALTLLTCALLLTVGIPLTVAYLGPLDWGPVVSGYLGMILLSGAYLSLGLVASACCRSQVVAFILGFILCIGFYLVGRAGAWLPLELAEIANALSFDRRVSGFSKGVIDLRDVVFFTVFAASMVGLSAEILHSRRWSRS